MKSRQASPKTPPGSPPPPPPSGALGDFGTTGAFDSAQDPLLPPLSPTTNPDDQSPGSANPGSSKTAATTAYTAWTTTTSRFEPSASSIPEDVFMHEESDFATQNMVSDDEDIGSRHIPRVNLNQDWFKPLSQDERLATPKPAWSIPSSSLPIGDIGVFIDWFCKKQGITELTPKHLEGPAYEVVKAFHPDGDRHVLSIKKMKACLYYPESCIEQMVPDQILDRSHLNHLPPKDKKILSTAVNLWIRSLFIRKRVENFQLGIESYQTQLNLTKPRWEATGLEFMHDYKILDSSRSVVFRDKYGMQMIIRFNEIHKFSYGTLQQIDEALDYQVKEFKVNKVNPGLNTRLFKHVVSVSPELAFDGYLSHDRAMHPLAPHYERKTRADRGKKIPREQNASSSSATLNHPSSSHPLKDSTHENDDESSHSNPSSPPQNTSSLSNNVSRVPQNPPHESHDLNTLLYETMTLKTQQRDAH
ncbi:hypothetical protein Tco_0492301 [Tanacetum coccineum]